MNVADLAFRLGLAAEFVSRLLDGEEAISRSLAFDLQQEIGGTVEFWLNREEQYRQARSGLLPAGAGARNEQIVLLPPPASSADHDSAVSTAPH